LTKISKISLEVTTLDMIKPSKTLYGLFMIEIFYVKIKQKSKNQKDRKKWLKQLLYPGSIGNEGCMLDNRLFCVWLDSPSS